MAGLFDDKSLRIPPQMGKAARSKLNKHGFFRMPPNMKGVPAAAKGGLGGAHSKGRKMRGFAEGGWAKIDGAPKGGLVGEDDVQPLITSNYIESIDSQDDEGLEERLGGLAAEEEIQSAKGWDVPDQVNAITQGRDRIAQIQQAQQDYQKRAEDYLANFRNPNEGAMNIPALQFAAGMMSPTKTGSFGEGMGYGIGAGASALANQRKQDLEFEALRTKLGLDVSKTPLESQLKLADLEDRRERYEELMDWRRNKGTAPKELRTLPASTIEKLSTSAENVSKMKNLADSYKPGYGGTYSDTVGELQNWWGSREGAGEESKAQSNWWKDYNDYVQYIRHDLYGSAFTKSEQSAWDKANVTPGMSDEAIQRNLGVRADIADKALKRKLGSFGKAGYKTSELEEYLVDEPKAEEEVAPASTNYQSLSDEDLENRIKELQGGQ